MNYGDIFVDTFRVIWREKKLWVISALGVSVFALVAMISSGASMGWQMNWMGSLAGLEYAVTEEDVFDWLMRVSLGFLALFGFMGLFGLVGYIINLIARAGVVAEAARAWRGEKTDISRGLGRGAHKAPAYFILDLIWSLPWILAAFFGLIVTVALAGGMVSAIVSGRFDEGPAVLGLVGGIFFSMALFACLALIFVLFKGVFAPLMYQSSAGGDKTMGEAISEGWRLAKENVGPMLVFLILVWAVRLALFLLFRIFSIPFSFLLMSPWFGMIGDLESGVMPGGLAISPLQWFLIFIGLIGVGVLTLLWKSVEQSITLTLYAGVYQNLVQGETPEDERASQALVPESAARDDDGLP